MKIATLILLLLMLSFAKVSAQITFVKKYEIPQALSGGISIVEDISGGIYSMVGRMILWLICRMPI